MLEPTQGPCLVESTYHLKWIRWNCGKIPIIMQYKNGPCPLIATMNVLLLREKVKLPTMLEQITADQLLTYLGECVMDCVPTDTQQNDENSILNIEQNIHDAMEILPKLKTGLDVNIKFTGITDFEYTPECIIFDLLRIPLYHGWLIDPSLSELQSAIGNQSYNQLVDNIITNKSSTEPEAMAKVLIAEEFLERTASQLTLQGLHDLKSKIKDNEIGILFRNNHFLTLFKRESEIYTLVTDHGYLTEDNIIWETLDNIEGAGRFFDSNFTESEVTNRQVSEFNAIDQRQQQLVNDYLMALSLKEEENSEQVKESETTCHKTEDDFEIAKQLQAEEDRIYEMYCEREANKQQQSNMDKSKPNTPLGQPDDDKVISTTTELPGQVEEENLGRGVEELHHLPNTTESFVEPRFGVASTSSTEPADIIVSRGEDGNQLAPTTKDSQDNSRPQQKPSNRRSKSEKNLKESNCIVN